MRLISIILLCIVTFFLVECAQQTSPSGGGKDLYPPILDTNKTGAIPANFSTGFNNNEIVLLFDEYVELDNPNKNIVITPPLEQAPQYRLKGKKLIISLPDSLLENTTYTINFGSAVKDLTEGNMMKNFSYVFSTGDFIDSLFLAGSTFNAESKTSVEDITIMLYSDLTDSAIVNEKPLYFTNSDISGKYKLNHLKSGTYKVIGLEDKNNDLKYNKNERIAFLDSTIHISSKDTLNITLSMFTPVKKRQFVESKSFSQGKVLLVMNKPSDSIFTHTELNKFSSKFINYNKSNDSITIWLDSNALMQKSFTVVLNDMENKFFDTIKVPLGKSENKNPTALTANVHTQSTLELYKKIKVVSSSPLSKVNQGNIHLVSEKDTVPFTITHSNFKEVMIHAEWKEEATYYLTILPNALNDIYGNTSDTITKSFTIKEKSDYGSFYFKLNAPNQRYILHLMNGNTIVKDTLLTNGVFESTFDLLPPGNYNFKLVFDDNQNGKWNTGNYWTKQQPERIEYYNQPISIRPGWDQDIEWEIKK